MSQDSGRKFTMADLRAARASGAKVPMLTCYDYTTAGLMQEAGVPALLVGDSAGSVILGHANTLSVPLDFLIELTAAVRRGAPKCLVMGDMPFGSYQAGTADGVKNVIRMVQLSGCDCVKIEAAGSHLRLVRRLSDAGIAVIAHVGLRPQSIGLLGQYRAQGRTPAEADRIVSSAARLAAAGAGAILLEAVPPEVSARVVEEVSIPVIGCGAGPACHAYVFVTHDALGLTPKRPKFAPELADLSAPMVQAFRSYVQSVSDGKYPAAEHNYGMPLERRDAPAPEMDKAGYKKTVEK
jgi:3-methyl-2-oxobutanoate hydroxymethyltransferase